MKIMRSDTLAKANREHAVQTQDLVNELIQLHGFVNSKDESDD